MNKEGDYAPTVHINSSHSGGILGVYLSRRLADRAAVLQKLDLGLSGASVTRIHIKEHRVET